MKRSFVTTLESLWRRKPYFFLVFLPLSFLYYCVISIRYQLYRCKLLKSYRSPVPIWVVGNLAMGGSGKTPLIIALIAYLKKKDLRVGVVSRGYGGTISYVTEVKNNHSAEAVGDEPKLIVSKSSVPLVVGRDRVKAVQKLLEHHTLDLILSDDGLSHYALHRDLNLLCQHPTKDERNPFLLPAGPWRDNKVRGRDVAVLPCQMGVDALPAFDKIYRLGQPDLNINFAVLREKNLMAIAGIAKPQRFFQMLTAKGLVFETLILPDHHRIDPCLLKKLAKHYTLVMTEKDAIKYQNLESDLSIYVVSYALTLVPLFQKQLDHFLPQH